MLPSAGDPNGQLATHDSVKGFQNGMSPNGYLVLQSRHSKSFQYGLSVGQAGAHVPLVRFRFGSSSGQGTHSSPSQNGW